MTLADAVAVLLWVGVTAYAVFGGADFGSGFWDLTAGRARHGARLRALVDITIGPVWEANHVWLIFCLVVLWTCFPLAYTSLFGALWIPFVLAGLGIVLRGAGFAFRKAATQFRYRRVFGAGFAVSSVLTPLCFGLIAGAIASGRVPVGTDAPADPSVWLTPTSLLGGVLAVTACAFLAATFLVLEAHRRGDDELRRACTRRAIGAGVACGVVATAGIGVLAADATYLFEGLTHEALPLVLLSAVLGAASLVLLARGDRVLPRLTAVGAVACVIWAWGLAQSPMMIPPSLSIAEAAAPSSTLATTIVIAAVALAVIAPSMWLLYRLTERDELQLEALDEVAAENVPH